MPLPYPCKRTERVGQSPLGEITTCAGMAEEKAGALNSSWLIFLVSCLGSGRDEALGKGV